MLNYFNKYTRIERKSKRIWRRIKPSYSKAYLYNLKGEYGTLMIKEGKLSPTVFDPEGVLLSKDQTQLALDIITEKIPFDDSIMGWCFEPRHSIVFYDDCDQPLGHIDICFSCYTAYARTDIEHQVTNIPYFKNIIEALLLPILADEEYLSLS